MKTLDRLNIKSLDGLAVMNVNEPSVGDYERIMAENRRLVAASAEYEKIIAELEKALNFYCPANSYDYDKTQGINYIWNDQGKVARQALQKLKEFRGWE